MMCIRSAFFSKKKHFSSELILSVFYEQNIENSVCYARNQKHIHFDFGPQDLEISTDRIVASLEIHCSNLQI